MLVSLLSNGAVFPAHVVVNRRNPKAERAHARKVTLYGAAWIELNVLTKRVMGQAVLT
jgi:hypothetical protein